MKNSRIIIGVCGSIAVYKIPELVRKLQEEGYVVDVVMTENAEKFITKLTFETICHGNVYTAKDLWSKPLLHTELTADLLVVAPATFNFISKVSAGIADDLLSCIVSVKNIPVLIAPAMNTGMWKNPVNQENLNKLRRRGFCILEPEEGELACGRQGKGRLVSIEQLRMEILRKIECNSILKDKKVVVTFGRTAEYIDNARVISNNSSGKTGFGIAEAFYRKGAKLTVIAGFTAFEIPYFFNPIYAYTAEEVKKAIFSRIKDTEILVMNMAVADYKGTYFQKDKYKAKIVNVTFEKVEDILKVVKDTSVFKVGFSVEDKDVEKRALKKLKDKSLDMIIANPSSVMGKDTIKGLILYYDGRVEKFQEMEKRDFGKFLVNKIEREYARRKR